MELFDSFSLFRASLRGWDLEKIDRGMELSGSCRGELEVPTEHIVIIKLSNDKCYKMENVSLMSSMEDGWRLLVFFSYGKYICNKFHHLAACDSTQL